MQIMSLEAGSKATPLVDTGSICSIRQALLWLSKAPKPREQGGPQQDLVNCDQGEDVDQELATAGRVKFCPYRILPQKGPRPCFCLPTRALLLLEAVWEVPRGCSLPSNRGQCTGASGRSSNNLSQP